MTGVFTGVETRALHGVAAPWDSTYLLCMSFPLERVTTLLAPPPPSLTTHLQTRCL